MERSAMREGGPGFRFAPSGLQGCSIDQLVGGGLQSQRDSQAERLGGLEVDDQLDFGGLLHRQIGRLLALEDAAGVNAELTQGPRFAAAQQSASKQPKLLLRATRRQRKALWIQHFVAFPVGKPVSTFPGNALK
jgi:hypothetical protein